jgi:hypothetical protein
MTYSSGNAFAGSFCQWMPDQVPSGAAGAVVLAAAGAPLGNTGRHGVSSGSGISDGVAIEEEATSANDGVAAASDAEPTGSRDEAEALGAGVGRFGVGVIPAVAQPATNTAKTPTTRPLDRLPSGLEIIDCLLPRP